MLNCNTAETLANLIGSSEAGMVHQKYLQWNHGLATGFRLDLGKGCNFGNHSSLQPGAIPKEALSSKPTLVPGEQVPPSQWECGMHHHIHYIHQHKIKEAKDCEEINSGLTGLMLENLSSEKYKAKMIPNPTHLQLQKVTQDPSSKTENTHPNAFLPVLGATSCPF